MLAMRLKRLEIKSQVEDGVGPVLSSASSSGASGGGASRPAHIRKIELLLEELVPLLPRGRKVRVLDLCNGESTLLEVMMLYLPSICQRFEYVSIDSNPDVDNGALFPGHIHICGDVRNWKQLLADAGARFKPGYFDLAWGSPPCTAFSRSNVCVSEGAFSEAIEVVQAVQECIYWSKAPSWFIENPVGRLATCGIMADEAHPLMRDHVRLLLSYCRRVSVVCAICFCLQALLACRWWLTMSSLSSVISAQIRCLVQEGYPYLDERRKSHGASVHERHAMRLADERVSAASVHCPARNDRRLSSRRSKDNCVQASPSVPCGGDQSRLGAGHRGPRSAGCGVVWWFRCERRGVVSRFGG